MSSEQQDGRQNSSDGIEADNMKIGELLTVNEVCTMLKMSASTLNRRINPKSSYFDTRFPRPLRMGPAKGSLRFLMREVDQYINKLNRK